MVTTGVNSAPYTGDHQTFPTIPFDEKYINSEKKHAKNELSVRNKIRYEETFAERVTGSQIGKIKHPNRNYDVIVGVVGKNETDGELRYAISKEDLRKVPAGESFKNIMLVAFAVATFVAYASAGENIPMRIGATVTNNLVLSKLSQVPSISVPFTTKKIPVVTPLIPLLALGGTLALKEFIGDRLILSFLTVMSIAVIILQAKKIFKTAAGSGLTAASAQIFSTDKEAQHTFLSSINVEPQSKSLPFPVRYVVTQLDGKPYYHFEIGDTVLPNHPLIPSKDDDDEDEEVETIKNKKIKEPPQTDLTAWQKTVSFTKNTYFQAKNNVKKTSAIILPLVLAGAYARFTGNTQSLEVQSMLNMGVVGGKVGLRKIPFGNSMGVMMLAGGAAKGVSYLGERLQSPTLVLVGEITTLATLMTAVSISLKWAKDRITGKPDTNGNTFSASLITERLGMVPRPYQKKSPFEVLLNKENNKVTGHHPVARLVMSDESSSSLLENLTNQLSLKMSIVEGKPTIRYFKDGVKLKRKEIVKEGLAAVKATKPNANWMRLFVTANVIGSVVMVVFFGEDLMLLGVMNSTAATVAKGQVTGTWINKAVRYGVLWPLAAGVVAGEKICQINNIPVPRISETVVPVVVATSQKEFKKLAKGDKQRVN